MAKMLMGQIDHARARVRAIKNGLIGKAPVSVKTYGVNDLVAGLRDGTIVFTGPQLQKFAQSWADQYALSVSNYNRVNFETVVLDAAFGQERAEEEKRFEAENLVYRNLCRRVNEEATKVEDAIVLGDNVAALAALQAFAAFKP